jgi:transcriptional regulator with XRE-family HTH domain
MEFYEKVELLRKERGVSVQIMAKRCGISPSTPTTWKTRHAKPGFRILQRLAEYFAVPVSFFDEDEDRTALEKTGRDVSV